MVPVVTVAVFLLVTVGVYLVLHRSVLRVLLGLGCVSHAVHLLVLSAGRWGTHAPIVREGLHPADVSDPLPQAFVLTAIVITLAFTVLLLAGMAVTTIQGGTPEISALQEDDGDLEPEEVRRELTGRANEDAA